MFRFLDFYSFRASKLSPWPRIWIAVWMWVWGAEAGWPRGWPRCRGARRRGGPDRTGGRGRSGGEAGVSACAHDVGGRSVRAEARMERTTTRTEPWRGGTPRAGGVQSVSHSFTPSLNQFVSQSVRLPVSQSRSQPISQSGRWEVEGALRRAQRSGATSATRNGRMRRRARRVRRGTPCHAMPAPPMTLRPCVRALPAAACALHAWVGAADRRGHHVCMQHAMPCLSRPDDAARLRRGCNARMCTLSFARRVSPVATIAHAARAACPRVACLARPASVRSNSLCRRCVPAMDACLTGPCLVTGHVGNNEPFNNSFFLFPFFRRVHQRAT